MLTIWMQSIMSSAITTKVTGRSKRVKVLSKEPRDPRPADANDARQSMGAV